MLRNRNKQLRILKLTCWRIIFFSQQFSQLRLAKNMNMNTLQAFYYCDFTFHDHDNLVNQGF